MKKQKVQKANPGDAVMGVAWYREIDWPRVKALFPDADQLHEAYAEWLKSAEDVVRRLKRSGVVTQPVIVDIDDLIGWSLARGHKLDAKARAEYTAETIRTKHQSQEFVVKPSSERG